MSDENFLEGDSTPSPTAAFLSGLLAGVAVPLLGILWRGWETEQVSVVFWWVSPLLSAALAGGAAAYKMGSSLGRVIALMLFAVCCAFFIQGVLEYITLYDATVGPVMSNGGERPEMQGIFRRWQFIIHFLSITAGALLGLMFGKRN